MLFNNNDKKYIIKRVIVFLIISFISYFIFSGCVKAQVGSNYINYPSNPRITQFTQGQSSRSYTIYNAAGNPYEIWSGLGQGYVIFTVLTSNGLSGSSSQLMSIDIASDTRTFHCEMGTLATYIDNTTEANIYSVKCPVDFSDNHGWKYIVFQRNNIYGDLYVHISDVATYVSEVSEAAAITSSQAQAAQQQITAIQNQALETRVKIQEQATAIINATNNAALQAHNDSQAINNSINSTDNDDTSSSCGIICKLKSLVEFIKPNNLIHLFIPTQQDWEGVFNNAITNFRNNLGVLGLVLSIFMDCFGVLLGTYAPNYCATWNDIYVPNFENMTPIISSGQFCLDTYFQTGILATFRSTCIMLIGGLIVFAFIQYCIRTYKHILNVQITSDDEYEYITSGTSVDRMVDDNTKMHTWSRHSYRLKR